LLNCDLSVLTQNLQSTTSKNAFSAVGTFPQTWALTSFKAIMKSINILFLFLSTSSICFGQKQDTTYRYFKGLINREYSITMELKQAGNVCVGYYYYDKYRQNVRVEGQLNENNELVLTEFDKFGHKTTSVFTGTYTDDWKSLNGVWENEKKDSRYNFAVKAIEQPIGQKIAYRFEDIRRFQELLNYFDLEPQMPFNVNVGIEKKAFRWKEGTKESSRKDYQQVIPYRLAQRYIMNQVSLKGEGAFNYFKIKEANYKAHEMHYKSLCCVYRTSSYVGLLFHFADDTGWDEYNVTFLLLYDYAGHLLDGIRVGKELNLEYAGKKILEKSNSRFFADSTIEMKSNRVLTEFGTSSLGDEFYQETPSERHIYYILQPSGRFIRQEVEIDNNKNEK